MEPESKPKIENRYVRMHRQWTAIQNCIIKHKKDKCPQSTEQCQSCRDIKCRDH